MNYDVTIIGGGISGLTAGLELSKKGKKVIILEKESEVGGLCRSFEYNGFVLDYGPHLLFLHRKETMEFIKNMGFYDQIYSKKLRHSLWYNGKPYDYTKNTDRLKLALKFKRVPFFILKLLLFDKKTKEKDAEKWLISNIGRRSYEMFFKPILYKRFMMDIKQINPTTLSWIIKRFVKYGLKGDEAYVRGGMGKLPKKIVNEIEKLGGEIKTKITIKKIVKNKNLFELATNNKKIKSRVVLSTIPPNSFSSISNMKLPKSEYLHSIFIFFGMKEKSLFGNYDILFPDRFFWFQRLSESTLMYENQTKNSVICADRYFNDIPKDLENEKEKCIESLSKVIPDFYNKVEWCKILVYPNSFAFSKKTEKTSHNGLFVLGQAFIEEEIFPSIDELMKEAINVSNEINYYLDN